MSDDNDDTEIKQSSGNMIEQPDAVTEFEQIPVDAYAAFFSLIKLAVDARSAKRTVRELRDAANRAASERAQIAADRVEHDRQLAADRTELAQERMTLLGRRQRVERDEAAIEEQRKEFAKLEAAWSGLALPGEPYQLSGTLTRARPFSGLQVAKYAASHNGELPRHPDAPLPNEREAEAERPTAVRHGPGDAGDWPANVSLTRQPEAQAVRVRVGRKSSQPDAQH